MKVREQRWEGKGKREVMKMCEPFFFFFLYFSLAQFSESRGEENEARVTFIPFVYLVNGC